jgi:hypothetical protein
VLILAKQDGSWGGAIMQRISEWRRYAEDCRKLAASLVNPLHKQKLLKMARAWDMLAEGCKADLEENGED